MTGAVIIRLVICLFFLICMQNVFRKAGIPGWHAFVPVYQSVQLLRICDMPSWWVIFLFIPIVNIIFSVKMSLELSKRFGRSDVLLVDYVLFIVVVIVAFDTSKYRSKISSQ